MTFLSNGQVLVAGGFDHNGDVPRNYTVRVCKIRLTATRRKVGSGSL